MRAVERGKVAAANKRHRGISTGKDAKGWNWKPGPDPEKGTWAHAVAVAKCNLRHVTNCAQDDYLRAAFPERYDCGDLI